MFSERARLRLQDVVENADRIQSHIEDMNLERFRQSPIAIDAVERCLSRITEAITQMGEPNAEIAGLGVSWAEIRGLGNRLRHEYRRLDSRIIFETARNDIPALRDAASRALERR